MPLLDRVCLLSVLCAYYLCNPEDVFVNRLLRGHGHVLNAPGIADEFPLFMSFDFVSARCGDTVKKKCWLPLEHCRSVRKYLGFVP